MKMEVEIEDGVIPAGKELVRLGLPKQGEQFIANNSFVDTAFCDFRDNRKIIVRDAWQWPEWLKAEWLAMDKDERWFAYDQKPSIVSGRWEQSAFTGARHCYWIDLHYFAFTPPPCTDWRQSLRRNPNAKGGA